MVSFLSGKKAIITGSLMVLSGGAELIGIDLPYIESVDAGRMIMEGFSIIFIRLGISKLA